MRIRMLLISLLAVSLLGCGESPFTGPREPDHTTTILNYTINGSNSSPASIDNSGHTIAWEVASSDPYSMELVFSTNTVVGDSDDLGLLSQQCGNDSSLYKCGVTSGSTTCTYDVGNPHQMKCGDGKLTQLTVGSSNPYLILNICTGANTSCKANHIMVAFP